MAKESTMTGTLNATWEGDQWKQGGGATLAGRHLRPGNRHHLHGHRQPGAVELVDRKGDNLYTASTLAINPDNGEIKWHLQTTPHDGWDFDGVNEFIPFDLKKDGKGGQGRRQG